MKASEKMITASQAIKMEKEMWNKINNFVEQGSDKFIESHPFLFKKEDYNDMHNETYDLPPREGDTKTDEEGSWYFEDEMWWLK